MYKALSPHAIGVRVNNLHEGIAAAVEGGFAGVEFNPSEVVSLLEQQGAAAVNALFATAGVQPAGWGLPAEWRGPEDKWRSMLGELPRLAQAAAAIGGLRCMTWIMPCSNDLPFDQNYRFHVERLGPAAQILAAHGCSLGLEFIGPRTLRESQRYPFIYQMEAMLEMAAEVGPNVGLLLDCWHWYTSHGSVDGLRALRPEQVVYVHVNDAPAAVPIDEQLDTVRALPGETGVIDIVAFLQALQAIGYRGPVTAEPFKKSLGELPSDTARLQAVAASMEAIFRQAGLG